MNKHRLIITLTGPSLSGKTTLMRRLQEVEGFHEIVSHTTRAPRTGEVEGKDYHFVTPEQFDQIEMVESIRFHGAASYGGSKAEFEKAFNSGKSAVVIVEPEGCKQIAAAAKTYGWRHLSIYVKVSPAAQLRRFLTRLHGDRSADVEKYAARFEHMTSEQDWLGAFPWNAIIERYDQFTEREALGMVHFVVSIAKGHPRSVAEAREAWLGAK
jgi:guanylate kinase